MMGMSMPNGRRGSFGEAPEPACAAPPVLAPWATRNAVAPSPTPVVRTRPAAALAEPPWQVFPPHFFSRSGATSSQNDTRGGAKLFGLGSPTTNWIVTGSARGAPSIARRPNPGFSSVGTGSVSLYDWSFVSHGAPSPFGLARDTTRVTGS
jgi:hypothetical protein